MSFDNMMPCSEEDAEFIEEQASRVFDTIAPPEEAAEEEEFVYKVTDEKGSLLGGCILAVDARKTASIYDLWVEEKYRRRGIASALVRQAEKKAGELGCYLVLVGTFDFQAKPFYEKHGYTVNDTMSGVPKGHEHYFMTKRLDRTVMEHNPSDTKKYEIIPGGEEDAEFLSGRLRRHDEAFAPRGHEYISKRSRTETAESLPALSAAWTDGTAQISMRFGWTIRTGGRGSAPGCSARLSGRPEKTAPIPCSLKPTIGMWSFSERMAMRQ